jgi:hypothetical protein
MWKQFHLEFFLFFIKMLNTQNQTLVTIACVHVSVNAPHAPLLKNSWISQNIKNNVNALTQFFGKYMFNVMN